MAETREGIKKMDGIQPVLIRQNQGARMNMEDRYSVLDKSGMGTFVGVYDGHGGIDVADILVNTISEEFFRALSSTGDQETAMKMAYRAAERKTSEYDCGATAADAFINCQKMVYANAGDCAIFVSGLKAKRLTPYHRVDNPKERARISNAGGMFNDPYYIHKGKGLMPTRGFGDRTMREVGLHSTPDVGCYIFSPGDRYVILTTDGISDVIDIPLIDRIMNGQPDLQAAARMLVQETLARGGDDNMTVLVAPIRGNRPV